MWRKTDDRKVWYEWLVDVYACLPTSIPAVPTLARMPVPKASADDTGKGKGRTAPPVAAPGTSQTGPAPLGGPQKVKKIRVGGSDLHSSEREACLM